MKKTVKILGLLAAAFVMGLGFVGCGDASIDDGTDIIDVNDGTSGKDDGSGDAGGSGGAYKNLYKNADGFECGPWNCWECSSTTATMTAIEEGVRLQPTRESGCNYSTQTYYGVNLAAGTEVGKNADLQANGFTKVVFEIRGTTPADKIMFYALTESKCIGPNPRKDANNSDVCDALNSYCTEYNASTWTQVTVNLPDATNTMKSALTISVADGIDANTYVEIKNIDWQDANGNSVVPTYAE